MARRRKGPAARSRAARQDSPQLHASSADEQHQSVKSDSRAAQEDSQTLPRVNAVDQHQQMHSGQSNRRVPVRTYGSFVDWTS